jgi:hypothetical protein
VVYGVATDFSFSDNNKNLIIERRDETIIRISLNPSARQRSILICHVKRRMPHLTPHI